MVVDRRIFAGVVDGFMKEEQPPGLAFVSEWNQMSPTLIAPCPEPSRPYAKRTTRAWGAYPPASGNREVQRSAFLRVWSYGCAATGPIFVPMTSPDTMISTRRFCWRPAAVLLSATGIVSAKPWDVTEAVASPWSTR